MIKKILSAFLLSIVLTACTTAPATMTDDRAARAAAINAQLGVGYIEQGRYKLAKEKLDKAMRQDPDNGDIYHYMAELYRRLNKPEMAESFYEKALDRNENDSALKNNYGVFLCSQKKFEKANRYFAEVLDDPIYQNKDLVYENMALCAKQQGNLFLAEKYLDQALGMNPRLPVATLELAQINFDKQQLDQARFHYERYLQIGQQNAQSLWLGYLIEKQAGNKNKAATYAILLKGKFSGSKEAALLRKLESR